MEDEVTKRTKKIYMTAKNSNFTFLQKAKEIIIEFFVLVFAITISILLNNWSQDRNQQKEVNTFLSELKNDLQNDNENISNSKEKMTKYLKEYKYAVSLTQPQIDSLKQIHGSVEINTSISTTKISNGNYEGFKSSGKIGYIENKKLKRLILKYYQEQLPLLMEVEKYASKNIEKLFDFMMNNIDKGMSKIVMLPQFKLQLNFCAEQTNVLIELYEKTQKDAKQIIKEIKKLEK